jgi:hypothetical protein
VEIYDDEYSGRGGSYIVKDGRRILVACTDVVIEPPGKQEKCTLRTKSSKEDLSDG